MSNIISASIASTSSRLNLGHTDIYPQLSSSTPNLSLFDSQSLFLDRCPQIDKNFFEARIFVDAPKTQKTIANILVALTQSEEQMRDYISFVFMHLPEFHITSLLKATCVKTDFIFLLLKHYL